MNIMITGKNGFVGRSAKNYFESNTDYIIDEVSLRNEEWVNTDLSKYDVIFHSAGITPKEDITDDIFYLVNRDITFNLAQKAKNEGVKHFIYLSSMAIYGMSQSVRKGNGVIFSNTPINPTSTYGKSKYQAEQLITELEDEKFKVSIIRAPSIYGTKNRDYFNMYHKLMNILTLQPSAFNQCKRSIINIDNLCELVVLIINSGERGIFCPSDSPALSTIEYLNILQRSSAKRIHFSRSFGLLLEYAFQRTQIVNNIWGAIAYDESLTNIFDGKYRVKDACKGIMDLYNFHD